MPTPGRPAWCFGRSFVPRLNIAVDYYNIEIDNAIAAAAGGVDNILNLCYNVIQDAAAASARLIIPRHARASSRAATFVVRANNANLGAFTTSGIDFQVDYSIPLGFSAFGDGNPG